MKIICTEFLISNKIICFIFINHLFSSNREFCQQFFFSQLLVIKIMKFFIEMNQNFELETTIKWTYRWNQLSSVHIWWNIELSNSWSLKHQIKLKYELSNAFYYSSSKILIISSWTLLNIMHLSELFCLWCYLKKLYISEYLQSMWMISLCTSFET